MEPKEMYCQVAAWQRLKEKGADPAQAAQIAKDVYQTVKKACDSMTK
jgi:hypothetical protein